eukprot:TRINITY_DN12346_c1_g3_i4.p1 TRINITY_DN12346_c1_g3~~TRINITY_DN12346_c1_g3_i4.p1  ORF type:complete len:2267 (+),score=490.38 TRINITY_DN12346_c1_g3_i4:52-6852(+)
MHTTTVVDFSAYRLRHVATGKYLCCHSPKEGGNSPQSARGRFGTASQRHKLSLVSSLVKNETEDYIDDTLATFHPLDALDETVKAGGYARIELASGGTWLHCTSDVITDSHGNTTNRLVAGAAPRLIYEDLFSIHTADFHIAPALARVMSIIPLLRSAAQIFAKPETYVTWDEMNFDNEQHLAVEDDPNEISYPDGAEKNELLAAMQVLITPTREDLEVSPSFPSARPKLLPISIDNGGSGDKIIDSPDSSALSQHFDSSDDDLDDCDAGDAAAAACVVVSIVAVFGSSSSPSPTSSNPLDDMTAPQITVVAPEYTVEFNNSMANMNSTNDVTSIPVPSFDIRQTAGRLGGLGSASAPATRRNSSIRMPPRSGQAPLWYVAGKYLKRSGLSGDNVFNKQGMAVPCVSAGAEIKEKVDQLTRASWKASLNRLIASTTTALSDLIAFLAQVPITETYKRPNLPISLSRAVSSAKVVFACRLTPVKRRQILLYEQGIHNLVYNLLSAPFKEGGLSLSSPRKYEALNVILRLGHRLIMHMVAGCDKVSEDVSQYIPFFERQSGFRLNASDTIHAIVHNHPNVLASLKDETIEKFVRFVPNYGRSPSYLNLLSALCVCCGKGITRTQNLVCNEVLLLQDTERSLLHRTRINKKTGQLEIELLRIESESLADHGDSSMILAHGLVTPTTGDLDKTEPMFFEGRQWVPLQEFVSSGTYNAVKYFERQLNLLAALCAENTVCSKRVAQLIPRDHILTALEKGTGSDAVLGDAVRTCFLALARVLYLQPSKISDVRLMQRWKRLLCEDAARNMTLCIERTSRNEQVCETLKCLLLLVESGRFSKDELKNLAPILCQLLDASTDAMSEALFDALTSGAASLMGHFLHIDASSVMWQQAIVDGLPRKGSDDAKFQSTDQNKKVMDVKLVACQLLKATQTYGIAISDWVHNLKVNIQGKGCLKGKHGLAKVLLEVTMYRGNDELFETAFLLLCNCLADDGDDVLANKYTGPDKTECSAVISLAAIIKQDVTNTPTHRPTPGQPPKDGVLVTHFVSHFANNFDDTFSVCFMLRVFTYLINSEKESGGEAAMRTMQCHLDRLGCTLLMTSLIEAPKEDVVEHALIFGIALLEEGNLQVQTQLMSYFDSLSDEAFFQCIRNRLHKAIAELKELEVKEKRRGLADLGGNSLKFQISPERVHQESKLSNVTKTLRLLQLFCEGHNLELQCYIHSQPDNLHSVDLVKESLMVLKATISVPPACYGSVLFELLLQCFNSLTEYCQGPCQENQESLVNAHLAREVSNILNLEYERATEGRINREQTDEVQNAATITLLSLLEGCEDAKVPNVLLQTVDLEQIGTALDMCWRNRKRGSAGDDGTDTALELGFNLFIFMETLASFDSQNFLLENKHFMRNENGYTYFHAMTGRIEIAAREGRLQRVYFRIPELCLNLSKSSRDSILWNVDRETSGSRISSFFSKADDALYEMWFNDKYFSSKTLHQGKQDLAEGSYSGILKIAAVWVQRRSAEIHNTTVWLSVLIAFLNGLEIGALVTIPVVGFLQLILTVVSLLHRAASQGPILAHTQQKDDQKGTWNRLHSEISPEGLLALRRAQDVQADIDLISNNVYTTTCYSPRPKRSPRKKSVFAETPSPSLSGVHQRTRHRSSPSLGMGSDSGILAGLQPSDSDTPIHVPPKTRHSISSASGGASLGVNESKLGASISGLRRTSLQLNSASQSTVGGGESHTAGQFFLSAKPRKARTWSDDDDDDEVTESNGSTGHKGSPGVTPNQWRRRSGELRPAPISATPLSATSSPDITTSTGNNSRSVSVKVPSLKFENLNTSSEPEPPTSPHVVSPLFADVTHSRNFKFSPGLKPYKGGFGNPNSSPLKKPSPTLSPTVRKGVKNCFAAQTTTEAAEDLNAVAGRDTELISVLQCLIRDSHFNGHCFMVLCSLLGLGVSPLFFTGQLFSIVANSPILQSVIRSITKNGRSLLLTGLLAVIIVFHFAVAGHAFFKESYQNHEEAASSLSRTFVHTFFNGIALGGISDLMHPPSFDADEDGRIDTMYGLRMAFDFSFFVIVVVILLNIIFGIIIDTFAELRAEKQKVEEEIRTRCFICGIEATEFDRHASGFDCHIKQDHNMWCYIYFIHHLRTKEESEFTGQESYVWNLMKALDLSFFPANRAICLQNKSVAGSEDADIKKIGRQQASRHEMALEKKLNELWVEQKAQNRKMDTRLRDVIGAVSSLQRQLPQIDDSPHARRTRSSSFRDLNTSSVRGCFQRNLSGV